jgi:hypothetical protein
MFYIWSFCTVNHHWVRGSGDDCRDGIMLEYRRMRASHPWMASVVLPEGQKPYEI